MPTTQSGNILFLTVALCVVLPSLAFLIVSSHGIQSTQDGSLATWLRLHNPRKVSHDAELVRRRMLGQLAELEPAELATHVPAILASLDHSDYHVRRLAGGMLSRLEPAAVTAHAAAIATELQHPDAQVRLIATQTLGWASATALSPFADLLLDGLSDEDAGVRWAAVDAMAGLAPDVLANRTVAALDRLMARQELSLAKTAVSAWMPKLEGQAPDVLEAVGKLNFNLNFGEGGGGMASMMAAGAAGGGDFAGL